MLPNLASQIRTAFCSIAWKTGSSSPGEELMTLSTSDVAVCRSSEPRNSLSSRAFSIQQGFAADGMGFRGEIARQQSRAADVRFVPKADSCTAARKVLIRVMSPPASPNSQNPRQLCDALLSRSTIRRGQRSLHAQGLATSPTGSPGNRGNHAPCDRSEGGCVDCRRR